MTTDYLISDGDYELYTTRLHSYIDKHCIVRDKMMPGKAPGTYYTWMFYLRRGLFNVDFMENLSKAFLYHLEREIGLNHDIQVSGLETAATPMLTGMPIFLKSIYGLDVPSFVVRKDTKEYGLLNDIEGIVHDRPVLLCDDLCNSSASLSVAFEVLLSKGISILPYAFVIVNKYNKGIHDREYTDMYLPKGFKIISLFGLDDFGLSNPSH